MKKLFIVCCAALISMSVVSSTIEINFNGETTSGNSCTLDSVLVENITQGWSEIITSSSYSIEVNDNEDIDDIPVDQDFRVINNVYAGKVHVLFNLSKEGKVHINVYDILGHSVCQSNTEQQAGSHTLEIEFGSPQMYYIHISTPDKEFSSSILNLHSGSTNKICYIGETDANRCPRRIPARHSCNMGDEMRYTGYTTMCDVKYADVCTTYIRGNNSGILFIFEIPNGATITVAEAIARTINGDAGTYNIVGYATSMYQDYNTQFDNQSFYMSDTKGANGSFVAWRVKNDNVKSNIEIGTKVMINNAKLVYYNNRTPETVAGATFTILETLPGYYIKHSWGSGADEDWTWKKMTKVNSNEYTYTGSWGGIGANINTTPDDSGAQWFPESSISNSAGATVGEEVTFKYLVSSSSLKLIRTQEPPTPQVPNPPTGLRVTETNDYRIVLEWNAVSNASYYQVYRATSASGTYTAIAYTPTLEWIDIIVQTGSTFYYKVSAINEAGESQLSSYVSGTAIGSGGGGGGGGTSKPSTPTGVTATASSSYINITWNSVSGATSYKIYRSTSASGSYSYIDVSTVTRYSDYTATAGTTYYYKVSAVNSAGESSKSSYASATISGGGGGTTTLAAPTNVTAAYMLGAHQVQVTWSEPALADSYEIYRSTSASSNGSKIGTATSSVYVDKLSSSIDQVTYYYRVKAKSSYLNQTSDYSEQASTYVDKNPMAPCPASNLKITGTSSLSISWSVQTQSGCGTPTERWVYFYDYSSSASNKWVSVKVTSNSYTLTSAKLNQYTNNGTTLAGCIELVNTNGNACLHFEYNTSTKKVTIISTSCN